MVRAFWIVIGVISCIGAPQAPAHASADADRPRSIFVLDQSEGPLYDRVFSGIRAAVNADSRSHVTIFAESLDLSRFCGADYEEGLQRLLKQKYRDRPIGVVVAIGAAALELALRWHAALWPVVFAMVNEADLSQLKLPPYVTGGIVNLRLQDTITVARARRLRNFVKQRPYDVKVIDLNETIREVVRFVSTQASALDVELDLRMTPEVLQVKGDQIQLQQVILNLMLNGIEAMAQLTGGRAVTARTILRKDNFAEISISGSGPGLPSDMLARVFDPFYTTKEQGMGIGLSIARTIVEAHRGRIWADNDGAGGAMFRISLPLAKA